MSAAKDPESPVPAQGAVRGTVQGAERSDRGAFIVFEGIDGAGKSSHIDRAADWLVQRGRSVTRTREPGGTPLAESLRDLLISARRDPMPPAAEALLAFAARADHLDRVIGPALRAGQWVISDRFTDSTFAYQGGGSGVPWARIAMLEEWIQAGLEPDRVYLFDLPATMAADRRTAVREADRFEREAQTFHERVRQAYLTRAHARPDRYRVIDASGSMPSVWAAIETDLADLLAQRESARVHVAESGS